MNTDEKVLKVKNFFGRYKMEHLTENNLKLIQNSSFCANKYGKSLEVYLKESAWQHDNDNLNKIYLVKDEKGDVAAYFSVKCGLLYEPNRYDILPKEELAFVDMILDAIENNNEKLLTQYKGAGSDLGFSADKIDKFFEVAHEQHETRKESNTLSVKVCHPAIELAQICKNDNYCANTIYDIPVFVGIFWEVVVPYILDIAEKIGCKYVYLFAADHTLGSQQKLLLYYKNNLKFQSGGDLIFVKPYYDKGCYPMYQEISELKENREGFWREFIE